MIGAGGVFKQLLIDRSIGVQIAESMPPLVLAYLTALLIRVTQGFATVVMITSAGITALLLSLFLGIPL